MQSINYRIAIPTIGRSQTIKKKTLDYLLRTDIDISKVDIFFSKPEEIPEYKESLKDIKIGNYVPTNQKHIRTQRNFISKYYPENTFVVGIDDDIESLQIKIDDKKTHELTQLNEFILNAFNISQKNKSDLWGISAVLNPYFMKNTVSFNLKYIVGCFYGWRNTYLPKNILSEVAGPDGILFGKEDYEKSIQYYKEDGKVTRFNYVAPKTKYYSESGGIQTYRTKNNEELGVQYLLKTYSSFCKRKKTKPEAYPEVRLYDSRLKNL